MSEGCERGLRRFGAVLSLTYIPLHYLTFICQLVFFVLGGDGFRSEAKHSTNPPSPCFCFRSPGVRRHASHGEVRGWRASQI